MHYRKVENCQITPRVADWTVKLLFFHYKLLTQTSKYKIICRVPNLRNEKTKSGSFETAVTRDYFTEMKYYTIQNYLKRIIVMLNFVIIFVDLECFDFST